MRFQVEYMVQIYQPHTLTEPQLSSQYLVGRLQEFNELMCIKVLTKLLAKCTVNGTLPHRIRSWYGLIPVPTHGVAIYWMPTICQGCLMDKTQIPLWWRPEPIWPPSHLRFSGQGGSGTSRDFFTTSAKSAEISKGLCLMKRSSESEFVNWEKNYQALRNHTIITNNNHNGSSHLTKPTLCTA